jgi:UDP-arabinose 4-epimerase
MKVLVTGGAGYIGSHTVRCLRAAGHKVVIYDNLCTGFRELANGFDLVIGDIVDHARIREKLGGVDAVIHFAAHAYVGESVASPQKYFRNNVVGALSLLDACVETGVQKFVFSSSCAVYGIPATLPIRESMPCNPVNPYGLTKMFFERALQAYEKPYGIRSVSLRYFNAAGADESGETGEMHDPETHLIPLAIGAAEGTRPPLSVFGSHFPTADGTCVRDYIHVSDLADAHLRALEYLEAGGASTAINLGTSHGFSVKEIMSVVQEETHLDVPFIDAPPREGDPPALVADFALAREVLGWSPQRDLRQIVRTATRWHRMLVGKHSPSS